MHSGAMYRIFALLLFLDLLPARASAVELVLVDEAAPPFMYDSPQGAVGLCPAIIREVFRRIGEPVVVRAVAWKRALAQAEGSSAGIGCLRATGERQMNFDFTEPVYAMTFNVYARRGRLVDYSGVDSLHGRVVGVRRGWSYGDSFDRARGQGALRIEEASGDSQNFDKLGDGRVDAAVVARATADILLAAADSGGRVEVFADDSFTTQTRIAFARAAHKEDLIQRIDAALAKMREDGTIEAMADVVGER